MFSATNILYLSNHIVRMTCKASVEVKCGWKSFLHQKGNVGVSRVAHYFLRVIDKHSLLTSFFYIRMLSYCFMVNILFDHQGFVKIDTTSKRLSQWQQQTSSNMLWSSNCFFMMQSNSTNLLSSSTLKTWKLPQDHARECINSVAEMNCSAFNAHQCYSDALKIIWCLLFYNMLHVIHKTEDINKACF